MSLGRRVLLAWELGGGYGHLQLMLSLADAITRAGHLVSLAVRDRATGVALLGDRHLTLLDAPAETTAPPNRVHIESWADLLFNAGWCDAAAVGKVVSGWLSLLRAHRIALVVGEFAPGAMLAARVAGIPAMAVGVGWNMPPAVTPLPAIRFWEPPGPGALQAAETRLLDAINAALCAAGGPPLEALAALFDPALCCLCSFPELDHYPDRTGADYFGAIYQVANGAPPLWPAGSGPRCFAYVNGRHTALPSLFAALAATGGPTILHLRGGLAPGGPSLPAHAWLAPGPVRLDAVLAERPIVICQGLNTLSAALVAGCPVLLLPEHLEQTVLANRLTQQGLGLALAPHATAAEAGTALRRLVEDPGYRVRAEAFSRRYAGYDPGLAVEAVVGECLDMLGA